MSIELTLTHQDGQVVAMYQDRPLAEPTPLVDLPRITGAENPYRYHPVELGRQLLAAMGGPGLLDLLEHDDPDYLLLLITDETTAAIPWEYAATPGGTFLVAEYGCLRLLPEARPAPSIRPGSLNFVILAADPLVDEYGRARTGYKLDIETELQAMGQVLANSGTGLAARRIPPTEQHLRSALKTGPAILHLSAHGNVIDITQDGQVTRQAVLYLEDPTGQAAPLRGDYLLRMPPRGVLRLVVFSACHTAASAMDASLARAMVRAGTPAAIGMQGGFPDPLSDELAANLYDFLLAGQDLAESLRQARQAMSERPYAVGLPVAYVAPGGGQPLPRQEGYPQVSALTHPHRLSLPPALAAPRPFMGREAELHHLAQHFQQGDKVVTVVGSGGIGKTALSAAFAERFGWHFPGGIIGLTLANRPALAPESLWRELLERLGEGQLAPELADAPAERLLEIFLQTARPRPPLIWLDNYESILQLTRPTADPEDVAGEPGRRGAEEQRSRGAGENGSPPIANRQSEIENQQAEAGRFHRLVYKLAETGLPLLLTSRRQPAGLPGELVFPPKRAMTGLLVQAGADLFLHHSTRAKKDRPRHQRLATDVAQATGGHPLAITLLAGEFDQSDEKTPEDFLATWDQELAEARRAGLSVHHATFKVAFDRSFDHLSRDQQQKLLALSRFPAPFFAQGAALLWQALETGQEKAAEDEAPRPTDHEPQTSAALSRFVHRSLLQVEGYFEAGQPATYRLEPVVARHLQRLRPPEWAATLAPAYAAYAAWLVKTVYGETGRSPVLARLTQQWLDELIPLAEAQPPDRQARYCWQLAYLLRQFGRLSEEAPILNLGEQVAREQNDEQMLSRIMTEQASFWETRGDLNQALDLYQQTLTILEQVGDLQGKGATLSGMANVFIAQNRWDQAEKMVTEALDLAQKLGAKESIAFNTGKLGQIAQAKGDLATARQRYLTALRLHEELGMPEAEQVRQMLAGLEGAGEPGRRGAGEGTPQEALLALTTAARAAVEGKHPPEAVAGAVEQLVALTV